MKSAIEKILSGDTLDEHIGQTKEYKRLSAKSLTLYEELYSSLTKKQKELFEQFYEVDGEMVAEMECAFYKEGFKLGLLLGMEASEN